MITAKLSAYAPEEVNTFLHVVNTAQQELYSTIGCEKEKCQYCECRHLCSDLRELLVYLTDEIIEYYPHVKSHAKFSKNKENQNV